MPKLDPEWMEHLPADPTPEEVFNARKVHIINVGSGSGVPGPVGPEGPEGPQGPVGPQGGQGPAGAKGDKGDRGVQGNVGAKGADGKSISPKGSVETPGDLPMVGNSVGDAYLTTQFGHIHFWDGAAWTDGGKIVGPEGPAGERGVQGVQGGKGDQGQAGPKGDQGPAGPAGSQGAQGAVGPEGPKGSKGDAGPAGPKGDEGSRGPQGLKGDRGEAGPQGGQGVSGPKGDMGPVGPGGPEGPEGPLGPRGLKGDKGDKGDTGNRGPQGLKGDKGDPGAQGPAGDPTQVAINTNCRRVTESFYSLTNEFSTLNVVRPQEGDTRIDLPRASSYGVGRILVINDKAGSSNKTHPIRVTCARDEGIDGHYEYIMGRPNGYLMLLATDSGDRQAWQVVSSPLQGLNYRVLDYTWSGGFRPNRPVNNSTGGGAHMYIPSFVRIVEPVGIPVSLCFRDSTTDRDGHTPGSVDPTAPNAPLELILNTEVNGGVTIPPARIMKNNGASGLPVSSLNLQFTNLGEVEFKRVVVEVVYQALSDLHFVDPELPDRMWED